MEAKEIVAGLQEISARQDQYLQENKNLKSEVASLKSVNQEFASAIDSLKKDRNNILRTGAFAESSTADLINNLIAKNFDQISKTNKDNPVKLELKVGNITGGNISLTGSLPNAPVQYNQNIITRPRRPITIRDLATVVLSNTGTFSFFAAPVTGAGSGSLGFQGTQGAIKAQIDKNLQMITVVTDYLSGYARIAKQILNDLPSMQSFLGNDLVEDYRRQESAAFMPQLQAAANQYTPGRSYYSYG
jgi:HK97 family phage major capsid protein